MAFNPLDPLGATTGAARDIGNVTNSLATSLTPQNQFNADQYLAQTLGNQNALAQALQAQSMGFGPNPAQSQYQQNVNQAIQQNAGFLSGQKGINPALAARMGAQNAAAMQQAAAGQAATLGAQQQLGAQNALQNLYGTMGQENISNAQLNAGVSAQNAAANQSTAGGILGGIGKGIMSLFSNGGEVPHYYQGATISGMSSMPQTNNLPGLGDYTSPTLGNLGTSPAPASNDNMFKFNYDASSNIANDILKQAGIPIYQAGNVQKRAYGGEIESVVPMSKGLAKGGKVSPVKTNNKMLPAHLEHISRLYYPDSSVSEMMVSNPMLSAQGGPVPGHAPIQGDSRKNDIVPAMLSPGEIVIPRSVLQSDNPVENAAKFVANELAKHHKGNDFKEGLKKAISSRSKK